MSDDYKIRMNKTVNLFRYAPVLDTNDKLVPINKLENNIDWSKYAIDPVSKLIIE